MLLWMKASRKSQQWHKGAVNNDYTHSSEAYGTLSPAPSGWRHWRAHIRAIKGVLLLIKPTNVSCGIACKKRNPLAVSCPAEEFNLQHMWAHGETHHYMGPTVPLLPFVFVSSAIALWNWTPVQTGGGVITEAIDPLQEPGAVKTPPTGQILVKTRRRP